MGFTVVMRFSLRSEISGRDVPVFKSPFVVQAENSRKDQTA